MRLTGFCTALGVMALTGCSAKDAAKGDSAKVAQAGAAAAPAVASRGTFDPTMHVAVIHARDFAFEAPDTITAGWTNFHLVNDGPALHHVQIVRLDSAKTASDLSQAMSKPGGPPAAWAVFVGGPNAPDPNGQSDAAVNLQAGNYALLCLVDLGDHVPHFAKGMVRPMTVTAASATPMAEPKADVTIDLSDYSFTMPTLTAGKHTIKVMNKGPQMHEMLLASIAPGKTSKDLLAWADKMDGPPPGGARGGVVGMIPGNSGYIMVDLPAGNYALLCFLPDSKDGKPHFMHGMVKDFKVN